MRAVCPLSRLFSQFYSVGILIVCFCHTLPLSTELEHEEVVCEVNAASPALFEHTHNGDGLFYG